MAKLVVPGENPGPEGGVRRVYDLRPGQAANILISDDSAMVYVGDLAIHVIEPGPYILMPLGIWSRTLSRAVANNEPDEPDELPLTRQARRAQQRRRPN